MKKKEYKSVTYGLRYKEYIEIFNKKLYQAKGCTGYEDFLKDAKILKKTKNCGKPSLLANIWIKRICEMDKEQLLKFVNNYKRGDLDPFQFERGYEKDYGNEEDEEETL